ISFLEEMWSKNLAQLFVSPLRPIEMITTLVIMSLIRTMIGLVPATLLADVFYGYSIYSMGWMLGLFFLNLVIMGWGVGLAIAGLVLRYGMSAEVLAWLLGFLFMPISGIYYPVSVLPAWLQPLAWALPSAHVFEGMRAVMIDGVARWDLMARAFALNGLYLVGGAAAFLAFFQAARRRGQLLTMGE
ncbi:MAG: ABC transporter permease, partial [Alphaproteobacteria bacterium]|nr:ABC transporter permease [Alphaproteobacteria bacterium]